MADGKGGGQGKGGKKGGATPPPNFAGAALAQSMSSRPNWSGPTGSQSWNIDPQTGQTSMKMETPFQESFNNLAGQTQKATQYDPTEARNQAIGSNLNQAYSRLVPQWNANTNQFNAKAANLGGTDNPMQMQQDATMFNNAKNDAFQGAINNAIQLGNQTQQVSQAERNLPFQQLGQLTNAAYATPYMGQAANYLGAANDQYGANRAYDAQSRSGQNSMFGGFSQLMGNLTGGKGGGLGMGK